MNDWHRIHGVDSFLCVLQVKMQELGVATHPAYQIVCYLDHKAMVTVHTEKYGTCSSHGLVSYSFLDMQVELTTISGSFHDPMHAMHVRLLDAFNCARTCVGFTLQLAKYTCDCGPRA
jgi:hypothetical protein